jgi:hypothetical protein
VRLRAFTHTAVAAARLGLSLRIGSARRADSLRLVLVLEVARRQAGHWVNFIMAEGPPPLAPHSAITLVAAAARAFPEPPTIIYIVAGLGHLTGGSSQTVRLRRPRATIGPRSARIRTRTETQTAPTAA